MHVHVTERCWEQAQDTGATDAVDKLVARVQGQTTLAPAFSPCGPHWKATINGNQRVIAGLRDVGGRRIAVFVAVFNRGGHDYLKYHQSPDTAVWFPSASQLSEWLRAMPGDASSELAERPPLPQSEMAWLYPPAWHGAGGDVVVYESAEWVRAFSGEDARRYWQTYHGLVKDACEVAALAAETGESYLGAHVEAADGRYITYGILPAETGTYALYLFGLGSGSSASAHEAARATVQRWAGGEAAERVPPDRAVREARRAYPYYLLWDRGAWVQIQEQTETNLALSAEEERLLGDALRPGGLPVFIDGRAGSGKSTMLMHAFAVQCRIAIQAGDELPLVYVTCNERLLEHARSLLSVLLTTHHSFLAESTTPFTSEVIARITQDCLRPYRDVVADRIPLERRDRFTRDTWVDFRRFRDLLRGQAPFQWREVASPELCWHVVRAYIKGYALELERGESAGLGPEDYRELPRKQRTVSERQFEQVYATVWPWYRSLCDKQGLWDDQDLVREALLAGEPARDYLAIFCDEAQDLTRLDLQLVMSLSRFRRYDLGSAPDASLPFAFAGDPFQTINPTGFRWECLAPAFDDEVARPLDPDQQIGISLRRASLSHNYRSSAAIVQLGNLVQLARRVRYDLADIAPQSSWFHEESARPLLYVIGRNLTSHDLDDLIGADATAPIIVPCEEGYELDFVREDEQLSRLFAVALEESTWPRRVMSAAAAKGLDLPMVVLYKFGASAPTGLGAGLGQDPGEDTYAEEYYFNKLYVALSRATTRLVIVETDAGTEELWAPLLRCRTDFLRATPAWDPLLVAAELREGTVEHLASLTKDVPPAVYAEELHRKGREQGNAAYLLLAAEYYTKAGRQREASECHAEALRFQGRFKEAGDLFLSDLGDKARATDSYWEGLCWVEFCGAVPAEDQGARARVARFMVAPAPDPAEFARWVASLSPGKLTPRPQWSAALRRLAQLVAADEPVSRTMGEWAELSALLARLEREDFGGLTAGRAHCHFAAGEFADASDAYYRAGMTHCRGYLLARAHVDGLPAGLAHLRVAEEWQLIADEWEALGGRRREMEAPRWAEDLAEAYHHLQRPADELMARMAAPGTQIDGLRDALVHANAAEPDGSAGRLRAVVDHLAKQGRYGDALAIAGMRVPRADAGTRPQACARILSALAWSADDLSAVSDAGLRRSMTQAAAEVVAWSDWSLHISETAMGAALERIGHFVTALQFYERYTESTNQRLRDHCRKRWIRVKQRQVGERAPGETNRRDQQLDERRRAWGIADTSVIDAFPTQSGTTTAPEPRSAVGAAASPSARRLETRVSHEHRRAVLTDPDTLATWTLDGSGRVTPGSGALVADASDEKEGLLLQREDGSEMASLAVLRRSDLELVATVRYRDGHAEEIRL